MGLFGLGKKKDSAAPSANDKISLQGGSKSVDTLKCILTAGLRNVDIEVNLSDDDAGPELTHGSFSTSGEQAITTYLDFKGQGTSFKPKKARHLGNQNCWMELASTQLDKGEQVSAILNRMNAVLGEQEYLAGPLSLAEAHVGASVYCIKSMGNYPQGLGNIDTWLSRIEGKIAEPLRARYLAYTS